jgi:hypothetical protein
MSAVQRTESALGSLVNFIVLLLVALGSIAYLMWHTLVLIGMLKGPILRKYEKYGDDEPFYYPLPGMFIAAAVLSVVGGHVIAPVTRIWCLPFGPGVILAGVGWLVWDRKFIAQKHPEIFQAYPRWCRELREYTSRLERRRIAYMWLRLPFRTRLVLNSNDRAFLLWADMVVVATNL